MGSVEAASVDTSHARSMATAPVFPATRGVPVGQVPCFVETFPGKHGLSLELSSGDAWEYFTLAPPAKLIAWATESFGMRESA
jgi:hypothetical protein